MTLTSVIDGDGNDRTNNFQLNTSNNGTQDEYSISIPLIMELMRMKTKHILLLLVLHI